MRSDETVLYLGNGYMNVLKFIELYKNTQMSILFHANLKNKCFEKHFSTLYFDLLKVL
jgi:hypothetical protein